MKLPSVAQYSSGPGHPEQRRGAKADATKIVVRLRRVRTKSWVAVLLIAVMYALHQDIWFWRTPSVVFGILPIGLFYHAVYTLATSLLLWLLIRLIWPSHLERETADRSSP